MCSLCVNALRGCCWNWSPSAVPMFHLTGCRFRWALMTLLSELVPLCGAKVTCDWELVSVGICEAAVGIVPFVQCNFYF